MWERYPKISKGSAQGELSVVRGEWVVTEKLHGSNFSIIFDGQAVSFAKRSGVLPCDDDFYGFRTQGLDLKLDECVRSLWGEEIAAFAKEGILPEGRLPTSIVVYGELLGGHYPHPNVPAIPGLRPVQCGVWYTPRLHFVAFDVAITNESGHVHFFDFAIARKACKATGFDFVTPLSIGSYADCVNFNTRFQSTLPNELSLPPLSQDNFAEGVVVRPAKEPGHREPDHGRSRGLLKLKIPEFEETTRYGHTQWREARNGYALHESGHRSVASDVDVLRYELLAAVTSQRLLNVVSKIGRVDVTDKKACRSLLAEFVNDAIESLVEDGFLASANDICKAHREELQSCARELTLEYLRAEAKATAW
mmetsp:Transcript_30441/g.81880  ORF Transcript_30441/g.81880 Transcript_30441/m.81880 type:complete len:364 (-) Transcript_30441:2386-3477(-)